MAKKCERCGTPALNDQSEFCNRCGSSVIEELKMQLPVCVRCGNQAPNKEVLFCNRCGTPYPPPLPELNCPRCGHSITDEESEFCNRCGAPVRPEPEPEPETLVCSRCGTPAPDEAALFCNRCGASISVVPVIKKPVCLKCGATPLDDKTLFCNRCGTPFTNPLSEARPIQPPHYKPVQQQASVKISKKKQLPVAEPPEDLWDPVPEEVMAPGYFSYPQGHPPASQKKKYSHLPLVADELTGGKVRDEPIVISDGNSKKYSHLPLVADEFKEKKSPRLDIETSYYPEPPKEKKVGKKGLFDLMKK